MFKKMLCLMLVFSMFFVMGACGGEAEQAEVVTAEAENVTAEVAETAAIEEAPAALSAELEQVLALGLANRELLEESDRLCTEEEAAEMVSRVHMVRYGKESKYLRDMQETEQVKQPVTRHFVAQCIYFSAMEEVYDAEYINYVEWNHYCNEHDPGFAWPDGQVITMRLDGKPGEGGVWDLCPDLQEINDPANAEQLRWSLDYGCSPGVNYVMIGYDRTNGKKIMELDENRCFRPQEVMTVEDVAVTALRYYNSFEEAAEMVPYADTKTFDTSIITPELLAKETTLPEASCQKLPSEWRGVLVWELGRVTHQALDSMPDKHMYEYEIQAIKDAGFNFIGLGFDFSRLQGPEPEAGCLNETRLKELDQVIAWFIERDIHVDLRCGSPGGLTYETYFTEWVQYNHDVVQTAEYAPEFAALWGALAKRYADIPNEYLSFNLMIEPEINSDRQYVAFFGPTVETIKEISPDRCIIADIHCGGLKGDAVAKMGVALSYHCYAPREFCAIEAHEHDADYLAAGRWPYTDSKGRTFDAEAVLDDPIEHSVSANELAATAEKNGVGFMIGEFGIFGTIPTGYRYPMETIDAYYTDMAQELAEKGYGWVAGVWNGVHGAAAGWPMAFDSEYTQVGDYPYYTDNNMMALFQKITAIQ